MHYSEICKSEVRRSDRRAATCVENSFCKIKKTSNEDSFRNISDSIKEMQVKYSSTQCWGAKTTRSCGEVN